MRSVPRILIADDNPANVDILRTRLSSQGYEIITANDGEAALEASRQHLPDLILLDVMMPKRDGFEVCRLLKSDPSLPFMPIILVTAKERLSRHRRRPRMRRRRIPHQTGGSRSPGGARQIDPAYQGAA